MGTVTRTELNQQTARVLARVAAGERLVITDRGRPVAEIGPAIRSRWERLVAEGKVWPAIDTGPLGVDPVRLDEPTERILADIRADRA